MRLEIAKYPSPHHNRSYDLTLDDANVDTKTAFSVIPTLVDKNIMVTHKPATRRQ